jgi:hypothetical protein
MFYGASGPIASEAVIAKLKTSECARDEKLFYHFIKKGQQHY